MCSSDTRASMTTKQRFFCHGKSPFTFIIQLFSFFFLYVNQTSPEVLVIVIVSLVVLVLVLFFYFRKVLKLDLKK